MIIPITWTMILFWLILLLIQEDEFDNDKRMLMAGLIIKLIPVMFGVIVGLSEIAGELWIAVDPSNVLTIVSFGNIFDFALGFIIIFLNVTYALIIISHFQSSGKDK